MSGLSLRTRQPNLKCISSAVLELLAFNTRKFTGSRDHDHAHFLEIFVRGHVGTTLGTRLPNLKFVPSAVLELLAFNAPKFTGSRDCDHAHFLEIFVRGHVGTDRQTDRQTGTGLSETTAWLYGYCRTPETGHHFQLILYSVQCCYAVHWTDNDITCPYEVIVVT